MVVYWHYIIILTEQQFDQSICHQHFYKFLWCHAINFISWNFSRFLLYVLLEFDNWWLCCWKFVRLEHRVNFFKVFWRSSCKEGKGKSRTQARNSAHVPSTRQKGIPDNVHRLHRIDNASTALPIGNGKVYITVVFCICDYNLSVW